MARVGKPYTETETLVHPLFESCHTVLVTVGTQVC